MTKHFAETITPHITRLKIPFENIYTSVFLVKTDAGMAILDCATTADDVKDYIVPALKMVNVVPSLIFISHNHRDHMGGVATLKSFYPDAKVALFAPEKLAGMQGVSAVKDGDILLGCLRVFHLPGHCGDAIALLDQRSSALISFDCLQAYGIGRYGTGVSNVADYMHSIKRIAEEDMEILVPSHDYYRVGNIARGKEEIDTYLFHCRAAIAALCDFVRQNKELSQSELAERFSEAYPELPKVSAFTMGAIANEIHL